MKKIVSKFSEKMLSKQQLKTIKGGTPYCFCLGGSPVQCPIGYCCGATLPYGVGPC